MTTPAPAPGPAPSPSPAPAPGPAPAQAPAAPSIAWLPDADADTVGYVQNKAWGGPGDMLKGYRNLETMIGAERAGRTVVLPAGDDPAEWSAVFDKLGRPALPADYGLPVPQGADPAFAQAAATKMHELGLPKKQAQALATWWNEQVAAMEQKHNGAELAASQAEQAALEKDWGPATSPAHMVQRELARRAMVELGQKAGLDQQKIEAALDAGQKTLGFTGLLKMLAIAGKQYAEHGGEGMGGQGGFGMTPEAARARRTQLLADKGWRDKAMQANSAEWAEMQRLDKIIAGAQ